MRYAIVAAAFAAAAAEPLAAVVMSARHAPHANFALPLERMLAGSRSLDLMFAVVAAITIVLLGDVAFALYRLLLVKRESRVDAGFARGPRRAPVAYSDDVESATAIGYRTPCVVLPAGLETRVDASELRAIIAHENAHLARYDDWGKALQAIVVRMFWFAPALWILARRLDLERELASDERVAAVVDPRAYAACLVRLAVDVPGRHVAPAAWRGRAQITIRVETLLRPGRRLGRGGAALRLAGVLATIVGGVFGAGALVPGTGPLAAIPVLARLPHHAPPGRHVHAVAHRVPAAPETVAVVREVPEAPQRPVLAASVLVAPVAMPVAPALPHRAAAPRTRTLLAALPAAEPASGAPCRTCAMLRRPVTDGPAIAIPPPADPPSQQPAAESPGPAFSGSRGYPWDPNSLAPSWAGLLY